MEADAVLPRLAFVCSIKPARSPMQELPFRPGQRSARVAFGRHLRVDHSSLLDLIIPFQTPSQSNSSPYPLSALGLESKSRYDSHQVVTCPAEVFVSPRIYIIGHERLVYCVSRDARSFGLVSLGAQTFPRCFSEQEETGCSERVPEAHKPRTALRLAPVASWVSTRVDEPKANRGSGSKYRCRKLWFQMPMARQQVFAAKNLGVPARQFMHVAGVMLSFARNAWSITLTYEPLCKPGSGGHCVPFGFQFSSSCSEIWNPAPQGGHFLHTQKPPTPIISR